MSDRYRTGATDDQAIVRHHLRNPDASASLRSPFAPDFDPDADDRAYARDRFNAYKARAHHWLARRNPAAARDRCRAMAMWVAIFHRWGDLPVTVDASGALVHPGGAVRPGTTVDLWLVL